MIATTAVRGCVLAAMSFRSWRAVRGARGAVRSTSGGAVRSTSGGAVRSTGVCVRRLAAR